jgi:hypothetical protein
MQIVHWDRDREIKAATIPPKEPVATKHHPFKGQGGASKIGNDA